MVRSGDYLKVRAAQGTDFGKGCRFSRFLDSQLGFSTGQSVMKESCPDVNREIVPNRGANLQ